MLFQVDNKGSEYSGIFAFKCREAEEITKMLKMLQQQMYKEKEIKKTSLENTEKK